jgi:murein DD-endopeptidase MepM/ murein hydrolase activator NlpD
VPQGELVASIDSLLSKRGSPMAGLGSFFVATGKKYGVDPRLVVGISGIESSFGTRIMGAHNAWGWGPGKPFSSWEEGISAVTQGLRSGYLDRGLMTPGQIVKRYAPASDGNDEANWAKTVESFMRELGGAPAKTRQARPAGSSGAVTTPPASSSAFRQQAALGVMAGIQSRGGYVDPLEMLQQITIGAVADQRAAQASRATPVAGATPPPSGRRYSAKAGSPLPTSVLTSVGAQHETLGLPGYLAHDYFGDAGAPVVAPVGGTIVRLSGHDPKGGPTSGVHGPFGWSLYLRGDDGRMYYLTHMGSRSVGVGTRVAAGSSLGTIGNYAQFGGSNHVHMGVH